MINYRERDSRRTIRLKEWDYSSQGAYFVTICSYQRKCIFEADGVRQIILEEWNALSKQFHNVRIDEFIVMPNHIHGIVWIESVWAGLALPNKGLALPNNKKGGPRPAPTLGDIVCAFKSRIAVNINRYRKTHGYPIWQRNYFERIIRNEDELNHIRQYIIENPLRWDDDPENPKNIFSEEINKLEVFSAVKGDCPRFTGEAVESGLSPY